jgi:hypothetical protein
MPATAVSPIAAPAVVPQSSSADYALTETSLTVADDSLPRERWVSLLRQFAPAERGGSWWVGEKLVDLPAANPLALFADGTLTRPPVVPIETAPYSQESWLPYLPWPGAPLRARQAASAASAAESSSSSSCERRRETTLVAPPLPMLTP